MHFDLKAMLIPLRILNSKLLLYHHLITLLHESLAKSFIQIQDHLKLFSLKDEISPFLTRHGVLKVDSYSKVQWRKFVSSRIEDENRSTLLEQAKGYKKLDSLSLACEDYKLKDYFCNMNLADARMKFRIRSKCVNTVKTMFPSDWGNIKTNHMCPSHQESPILDLPSRWANCSEYENFKKNRSLSREITC